VSLALDGAGVAIDGRWLVRGLDMALTPGVFTAIVGPNGSGKPTALRLLGGLRRPTEGRALIDNGDVAAVGRRTLARRVAFVPQDTHVGFAFTVRDVVAMGRHAHRGRFEREQAGDVRAIDEAMARCDVSSLAERPVNELSGGERQRVLIARSLATEAPHILLDEPTASLDIAHALDILALCRTLAHGGRAIAAALHDLNGALRFADAAVLLDRGRVARAGAAPEVLTPDAVRAVFGVRVTLTADAATGPVLVFDRA
jgi:iron complex transport system ATP-binding protein